MAKHVCLILHRKSANEPTVKDVVKTVRKEGVDLRVLIPWNKAEKPRIVRQALKEGAGRVIAGGGDGTINAVAAALVGKGKKKPAATLGVLPLGTANDFARGCELPVDDLTDCLRIACTRKGRPIDVGTLNGRPFVNVASAGFGAEITATTPIALKKALGGGAYTIMGLVKAFELTPYAGTLRVPGEEPFAAKMLFMAVGNNRFAGGGFEVAPQARLDDGLLDVAAVLVGNGFDPVRALEELSDPMRPENEFVRYRQLRKFTIEADEKLHVNLDGEPIHEKRLRFGVLPRHLEIAY